MCAFVGTCSGRAGRGRGRKNPSTSQGLRGHICGSRMTWCLTIGSQGRLGTKRSHRVEPKGKKGIGEEPQREAGRQDGEGVGRSAHHGLWAL